MKFMDLQWLRPHPSTHPQLQGGGVREDSPSSNPNHPLPTHSGPKSLGGEEIQEPPVGTKVSNLRL
jgi:hypothetical protein